ncbi:MAG TPA: serine protease [Flavobacteriales bacterium]|nr:serine protease [Flavobacteriales bacterium]
MKHLTILIAFFLGTNPPIAPSESLNNISAPSYRTIEINERRINSTERQVRQAAVKVNKPLGHGSGSLIKYKDLQLVLTAQHIADGELGERYLLYHGSATRIGLLLYSDEQHDLAILLVAQPFETEHALKYSPRETIPEIGSLITYSGFPAAHSLMTYRGRVAGYETFSTGDIQILLHTFGYFGCSGSVIYDEHGDIVGILWGIDRGQESSLEDMIWVSPIQNLNLDLALRGFCELNNNELRACQ